VRAHLAAPLVAAGFLTAVPFPSVATPAAAFPRALAYFPVVGIAIGLVAAATDALVSRVLPAGVVAAIDLGALGLLTGGLHLDGLADSIDGLFVSGDRERRLAVMRGGAIGAFGAAGVAIILLAEYGALAALAAAEREVALIAGAALARWCMVLSVWWFPYAREAGAGAAFKRGLGWRQGIAASVIAAAVAVAAGPHAVAAAAFSVIGIWALGRWASRKLGGLTGDVYGACGELAFLVTLVAWVAALR